MAVERELRRLLEHARLPAEPGHQSKSESSVSGGEGNQEEPAGGASRVAVREIYEQLQRVCCQHALPSVSVQSELNLPELLVLVAEAAVFQEDFETAGACVTWFLSVCSTKNQFYCRIQLVRAQCASKDAVNATGARKLRKVLNAIHFVLLVLPVATDAKRRPQYDFLVYNASVTYWQVARQLMKKATCQYLLPSLIAIVDALKAVGEKDVPWLLRLQLMTVYAQIDAKLLASAAKAICDIVDVQFTPLLSNPALANDASIKSLYEEALRLQVHVGSFKDPECQKILASMKKSNASKRNSLLTKLQALKSGAFSGTLDAALTELFQENAGMPSFAVASTTDEEIITHLRGLDPTTSHGVDAEIMVEAGIIAAFRQEYRHATCCEVVLQTKGKNVDPKFRVLHQVLKAILLALVPPPTSANFKLNRHQRAALAVARRLEGVKGLERALLACKRQQDPTLMENVCLYAWNLSLPLLQPQSRDQLSRMFSLASASLEELDSLQLNLRVRLMFELGKLELSADFISKAQENVNKALGLDYGTIATTTAVSPTLDELFTSEAKWMRRPLDVHLLPLRNRLDVKLAVEDPTTFDEELTAAVEQLREAKTDEQRRRQMDRVMVVINTIIKQSEGADSPTPPASIDFLLHLNGNSAFAWYELKDAQTANKLAREALRLFFSGENHSQHAAGGEMETVLSDKSVMLLEVDLRLRLVELIGHELMTRAQRYESAIASRETMMNGKSKSRTANLGSRAELRKLKADGAADAAALLLLSKESYVLGVSSANHSAVSDGGVDDPAIADRRAALESELLALKMEVIQELVAALKASTRIGWGFVIENSAAYLWNYHFHVFRLLLEASGAPTIAPPILPECIAAFESALAALEALPATVVNPDLLASIALGLALAQEKLGKLDKATATADAIIKRQRASAAALPLANTSIPSISLVLLKRFGELKVRTQIQQNAKEVTPVDVTPQVKVASFLEAMETMFHQHATNSALPPAQVAQLLEKATGFSQKAMSAWQPVASDSLERVRNEGLSLEEQQQHLELYCEIWVRLGCGASRFQNVKQALDCGEHALMPITKLLNESEHHVWVTKATWKWLALAELLCARSILTLLSGETAAWTLIEATLNHLVHSTQYAARASAYSVVRKAVDVSWNAILTVMAAVEAERAVGESSNKGSEANAWSRLLPPLRAVLKTLRKSGSGRLVGEFGLLVLDVCEKANDWKTATQVAEGLLHSDSSDIAADHVKDITTFHAIAVASLGDSSGGAPATGAKAKDHDPLMQAKILRKIAFSSRRSPPAQLKALAAAHKELDGMREEQALVLMEMAEWFFTHHFPQKEVDTHLDAAMSVLVRSQQGAKQAASEATGKLHHGTSGHVTGNDADLTYSALWYADKLIRLFTMRAVSASSMQLRWDAVRCAVHEVYTAWQCIIDIANDADLREKFKVEAQSNQSIEFEEWRVGKTTAFPERSPQSATEWVAFYQQHATSLSSRFFMPWITALRGLSKSESHVQSIANPILTCSFLEQLMQVLASFAAFELLLPVICLYQVVYHALSPHTCRAMEIWIELKTYDVLEKLNLPVLSVPLQSALELLQSSGDAILKELQQQRDDAGFDTSKNMRHRALLQLSSVSVSEKVAQSVDLLLQFGFIRQAKVLLTMLRSVALRTEGECEMKQRCDVLSVRMHDLEGDTAEAKRLTQQLLFSPTSRLDLEVVVKLVGQMSDRIPDKREAVEAILQSERLAATTILSASECAELHQPMHTQAVAKYLTSLVSMAPRPVSTAPNNVNVDLDAICGLAQLKLRRATLLLQMGSTTASVEHALRVFHEGVELLVWIDAKRKHAHFKKEFALELVAHTIQSRRSDVTTSDRQRERWLVEARVLLREALVMLEDVRHRTLEPEVRTPTITFASPLEVELAELRLRISSLELQLEESATIVADQQMTWYTYEKETRHNIVEKWLDKTAVCVPIEREGSITRAFALASAATTVLAKYPELFEARGFASACQLQCQRLALYHNPDKPSRDALRHYLWTRFTSTQAPHETWVCAAGGGANARTSAGDDGGRSTPALSPSASATSVGDDLDAEVQQQLAALVTHLESELKTAIDKRHMHVARVCAYELVQVYGCSQPLACGKALLLYQSTVVREEHMQALVNTCLASTNVTRLHMNRCDQLIKRHTNAVQNSLPFQLSQLFLDQQSDIYKRMSVNVPIDMVLSVLPTTSRVLSLQFSPDRCFLYATLVGQGDKCFMMARMECTKSKLEHLSALRERIQAWRDGMAKALLSVDDSKNQDTHEFTATSGEVASSTDIDALEVEFDACIEATTEFLRPLLVHSAVTATLDSELPGNTLVLIVDRDLELLPLEALPMFDKADSISREFSIHLLYHRLVAVKAHPFRKEDVRVIVDPRGDDAGLHEQTLISVVHQFTKKAGAAFTSWKDAADHAHVPTTTDWQQAMLLRKGGGFMYAGPNRVLGSVLSLEILSGMNLASSCYALLLIDRAENQSSARRQSKIDSEKPRWLRELEEDPYACALLCSLCGVNVVVLNQWTTTFHANRRLTSGLLGGLAKGQPIAKAVRKYPETVAPVMPVGAPTGAPQRKPSGVASGAAVAPVVPPVATKYRLKNRIRFNTAVFGLGHLTFKASEV